MRKEERRLVLLYIHTSLLPTGVGRALILQCTWVTGTPSYSITSASSSGVAGLRPNITWHTCIWNGSMARSKSFIITQQDCVSVCEL